MKPDDLKDIVNDEGPGVHYVADIRNDLVEGLHRVHIAIVDNMGDILYRSGDPELVTYTRSCIKPIQALPILTSGAADHFGLSDEEIALISGSHSGQDKHLDTIKSILKKASLDEASLKCKGHVPFDKGTAKEIGQDFTPLHDNCSGKHSGALVLCKHMVWDIEGYLDMDHPLQSEILQVICSLAEIEEKDIHVGIDGCDIPNHALPIDRMAKMFSRLMDASVMNDPEPIERVGKAMVDHPFMVAGKDRFDTVIMNEGNGKILSKAGAAGLQTLAIQNEGSWIGISLKIEDGAYSAIPPLTYSILEELGMHLERTEKGNEYANGTVRTRSRKEVGRSIVAGELQKMQ